MASILNIKSRTKRRNDVQSGSVTSYKMYVFLYFRIHSRSTMPFRDDLLWRQIVSVVPRTGWSEKGPPAHYCKCWRACDIWPCAYINCVRLDCHSFRLVQVQTENCDPLRTLFGAFHYKLVTTFSCPHTHSWCRFIFLPVLLGQPRSASLLPPFPKQFTIDWALLQCSSTG